MSNDERRTSDVRAIPGLYDIEKHGNLQFQICNITTEDISIMPGDIVAVFDTLVQPPVDQFRPDYKHVDIDLDNIIRDPLPPGRSKSVHDLLSEMEVGPMHPNEKEQILKVMAQSLGAFARNEGDIGCFKGFKYKLELKPGAEGQFTAQFPLPMEKQKEVNIWMEKMYMEKVITPTDLGIWQSPSFVVPKKSINCNSWQ